MKIRDNGLSVAWLVGLALLSILTFNSCSKSNSNNNVAVETDGLVAVVDGKAIKVAAADRNAICSQTLCEPNYIYYANFGGKLPFPIPTNIPTSIPTSIPTDVPTPTPSQTPSPQPTSTSPPPAEQLDYSKAILKLPDAWTVTEGSREIVVAVIDTGVAVNHEDLANNIWVNEAEKNGTAGVDDDGNGYKDDVYGWDFVNNRPNAIDDHKHGTHCAGIIGAEGNGKGTKGASPLVKIMPLKFLSAQGSGSTDGAINAIKYATAKGVHIMSNSWGGGGASELLNQAIQDAVKKGIVFVAAAGNNSSNNDTTATYPANYPNVVAVASTDESDGLSSFSNYGKSLVRIAAPGSNIYSSVLNNKYGKLSGTSMACPQVSGALALAMSLKPALTGAQVVDRMCETADQKLLDKVKCGRMNVYEFVKRVSQE